MAKYVMVERAPRRWAPPSSASLGDLTQHHTHMPAPSGIRVIESLGAIPSLPTHFKCKLEHPLEWIEKKILTINFTGQRRAN